MFYIISNSGNYQELPYANSYEEAEFDMRLRYSEEEIAEGELEVIDAE